MLAHFVTFIFCRRDDGAPTARDENKARTGRPQGPSAGEPRARARCRASRPTIARRGSDPRRHAHRQTHERHLAHASSSSLKVQEDEEEASRDACHPWPSVRCRECTTFSLPDQHLGDPQALESIAYIARRALVEPGSSWRAGSLGLVLIGVALRGGAPPGTEAVRPWQDQAHNKTLCSASSQGLARCAPAHPPHPAAQGAGRTNGKINASRAEPPRPAAVVTRASAAPLTRPAVVPSKPAAAAALPKPAVALPSRPAAALPRTPKAGARTRPPKQ